MVAAVDTAEAAEEADGAIKTVDVRRLPFRDRLLISKATIFEID